MRHGKNAPNVFPLWMPFTLLVAINVFSLWNSINLYHGYFDLAQLLLGITLFWFVANSGRSEEIAELFLWIAISGAIVSSLGIAQAWGIDIPILVPTGGPGSTFGNKNMAAQYLLFVLPANLYLFISTAERKKEWFYAALAALTATYFVYTGTRAAWGSAMVATLSMGLLLKKWKARSQIHDLNHGKRPFLLGIMLFVLVMNSVPRYLVPSFHLIGLPSPIDRLGSMVDLERDESARARFAIWINTLGMVRDHPLLGVGIGNFQFNYPLYAHRVVKDPSFSAEVTAKEAHNDYVQLLAESGILGFGAFLWILTLLARRFWFVLTRAEDGFPVVLVIGFSLLALLLEAFWDFPFQHPVPIAFFWIFSGFLWAFHHPGENTEERFRPALAKAIIGVLAVTAALFFAWTVSALRGELYFSRGAFAFSDGRIDEAKAALNKATKINPYNYRYHFLHGLLLIRMQNYSTAIEEIRQTLLLNPYYINAINNLGVAYSSAGRVAEAVRAWETALKIWPDHAEPHHNLALVYYHSGQHEKALAHLRELQRLRPSDPKVKEQIKIIEAAGGKPK